MMDFRGKLEWGDPFYAIFINNFFDNKQRLQFLSKNGGSPSKNGEICFQKAETRFQNAQTALSRIFFARPWMDSVQKKSLRARQQGFVGIGVLMKHDHGRIMTFAD